MAGCHRGDFPSAATPAATPAATLLMRLLRHVATTLAMLRNDFAPNFAVLNLQKPFHVLCAFSTDFEGSFHPVAEKNKRV
jgi:hypothetical protein